VKNDYEIAELGLASEARISERVPIRCLAKLSYETQDGSSKTIKVRVVNMSASEVLIEALKPFPLPRKCASKRGCNRLDSRCRPSPA
jgi:hypothetical protein